MENNPKTPSLESDTLNLEKDLEDAMVEGLESFVVIEEEPELESEGPTSELKNLDKRQKSTNGASKSFELKSTKNEDDESFVVVRYVQLS